MIAMAHFFCMRHLSQVPVGLIQSNYFSIAKGTVSFSLLLYEYQPQANLGIINLVALLHKMKR